MDKIRKDWAVMIARGCFVTCRLESKAILTWDFRIYWDDVQAILG